jgi:fumarate hydratase, class II
MANRTERDSMGEVEVPQTALYGAQTQRAVENFPISGQRFPRRFLRALGLVKRAAAATNRDLGVLDARTADAIALACDEVIDGVHDASFPVDVYQTGSGTSTNMNANEVIANRAIQLRGGAVGDGTVHPNDHVNASQSSNDVMPTALHVAAATAIHEDLVPALRHLAASLDDKAKAFAEVLKSGRTHNMDATPITLGQEFSGYAAQAAAAVRRAEAARDALLELALGGTAVGTGINCPAGFAAAAIARLAADTGLPFREAANHFEAQAARDGAVEAHGHLNTIAVSFAKVAHDLRWLGSGPRAGLFEIRLPETQPGSSIMPGKVNPVMCEMLTMVCARVIGNHATITVAGMGGAFELNAYTPVIADAILQSILLLANGTRTFTDRCVVGITANVDVCERSVERNLSIATALVPAVGYDVAASIAKEAFATDRTAREVAKARKVLSDDAIDRLLDAAIGR